MTDPTGPRNGRSHEPRFHCEACRAALLPRNAEGIIAQALFDHDGCAAPALAELHATYRARAKAALAALGGSK